MKRNLLIALLVICTSLLSAQTQVPENSTSPIYYQGVKVGIGTLDPTCTLHVNGTGLFNNSLTISNTSSEQLKLGYGQSVFPYIGLYEGTTLKSAIQWDKNRVSLFHYNDVANTALQIKSGVNGLLYHSVQHNSIHTVWHSGNTNNPNVNWSCNELDINGGATINNGGLTICSPSMIQLKLGYGQNALPTIGYYEGNTLKATTHWNSNGGAFMHFNDETNTALELSAGIDGLKYHSVQHNQIHTIWHAGNANNPGIDWTCMNLDVNGNIKAHEIEVTLANMQDLQLNGTLAANNINYTANGNTADFVFEDNYHLKDLSEVEAFIKANKHLPEIPSAAEMEATGVNLAEMNKLLLMKVEELTLYSIDMLRKVEQLEDALKYKEEQQQSLRREFEEFRVVIINELNK